MRLPVASGLRVRRRRPLSCAMDSILIIDFGSQVTQLIARRVRESGVYCEVVPFHDMAAFERIRPRGVILSGGPESATRDLSPQIAPSILDSRVPLLGICYGQQVLCAQLGGVVVPSTVREFGRAEIMLTASSSLFDGIAKPNASLQVWMSHGDRVESLPPGFTTVATSRNAPHAAIADEERHYYGVQFHPEVLHTPQGADLLRNFTHKIAGCADSWNMGTFREQSIASIRETVGDGHVICALSGGVDSSVVAVLLHEAIGSQLTCVYVDNGLMRAGESDQVVGLFRDHFNIPLIHEDASELFLTRLRDVSEPEAKRKTIGATFIDVFERIASGIPRADFLAQGTLYPDVIESVSVAGPSALIKSHHNVGGLPARMQLRLIEPVRHLFKDEVRALGCELGLPEAFIGRHPFPGPGLAIRIPGVVTAAQLDILRCADQIFLEEIRTHGLYDEIWQAFAVLLPVRSVGVMGDSRSYDYVCALRAVISSDGMTADYYRFDHDFLSHVATRIINEVDGINRITYDITSKPPGTIEWE